MICVCVCFFFLGGGAGRVFRRNLFQGCVLSGGSEFLGSALQASKNERLVADSLLMLCVCMQVGR